MLAAKRKESVRGRTKTLVVSIRTRNGFNQSGAPSGRKWAVLFLGLWAKLEIIRLNQMGNPRERVNTRCLDVLNMYGINPIRLIITSMKKMVDSGVDRPLRCVVDVRDSWVKIVSLTGDLNAEVRAFKTQNDDWIIRMIAVFVTKNRELSGKRVLNI